MQCKTFEIRDRGTFIPAMAILLESEVDRDNYLLGRAGLGRQGSYRVALFNLCRGDGFMDLYRWGPARTIGLAHEYIEKNFNELETGSVIDVEFILGETPISKISEQFEVHDVLNDEGYF